VTARRGLAPAAREGSSRPNTDPADGQSARYAVWVLLPVLGAPLAHAPVLRWDLLPGLRRPISRRLFGQNKTWRGALVMTVSTVAASAALRRLPAYRARLPPDVDHADATLVGGLLGIAVWAGELPNSLLKRRLGIPPGQRRSSPLGLAISVFDQADWVPTAWLLLRPVWRMPAADAAKAFLLVAVVHVPINLVGYAIGARETPL
jgi:CDP-diacylglycerol--serine O-phosphatidyltransferase